MSSGNAIKPFITRQFYIAGGSFAVAASECNYVGRCCHVAGSLTVKPNAIGKSRALFNEQQC